MDIRGIDFVAYQVRDLDRAVEFYRDMLGLKLESRWQNVYAEFDVAGTAFGLLAGQEPAHASGVVAFNVPNMDQAVAELEQKGVKCHHVEDTPVCRMGSFTDPDGNDFMLHEKLKAG